MQPWNALISRTAVSLDKDRVAVTEVWDTTSPDCPFVFQGSGPAWRSAIMDQKTFAAMYPVFK